MRTVDYFFYIECMPTKTIVKEVDDILTRHSFSIEANSIASMRLYDYEIEEEEYYFTIEDVKDPIKDLEELADSASGGYITYQYDDSDVLVGYERVGSSLYHTDVISLSFQYVIHSHNEEDIQRVVKNIHQRLNAVRTIGGEGLSEDIDIIRAEFDCIKEGNSSKSYAVDMWR